MSHHAQFHVRTLLPVGLPAVNNLSVLRAALDRIAPDAAGHKGASDELLFG